MLKVSHSILFTIAFLSSVLTLSAENMQDHQTKDHHIGYNERETLNEKRLNQLWEDQKLENRKLEEILIENKRIENETYQRHQEQKRLEDAREQRRINTKKWDKDHSREI